jgi:transcription elongation GreA/GreB family factor
LILTHADFANLSLLGGAVRPLLENAEVVSSDAVPREIVTMNSQVVLAYESTGVRRLVTLVYPPDAQASLDRISVLDPLGMALLGARPGQLVRGGMRIEKVVHQPERSLRDGLITGENCTP